jgi:nicotinamidase-related amidase
MTTDPYLPPDFSAAALLTIDTQRDVLDGGSIEISGTSQVLPQMQALVEAFRAAHRPIVHVVRLYRPDGENVDLCRRSLVEGGASILAPATHGAQLAPVLLPDDCPALDSELLLSGGIQPLGPREAVVYKPRWSAFYGTPLEAHLRGLGVSTLVFAGANFPNCPRASIYDASCRDFRLALAEDAVSGLYERGRAELENIGVSLMRSDAVAEAVRNAASSVVASPP